MGRTIVRDNTGQEALVMDAELCVASNGNGTYQPALGGNMGSMKGHASADGVLSQLIGKAPAFEHVMSRLPTLAHTDGVVLITGETGTGKELVARAIHQLGPRASRPFVAVNCGSLVDTLLEGELFGHERGAFTDAHARRQGLVAHAAGGTLFLDEAETLTPRAQVTLLRVVQERTFRLLGSPSEQRIDIRFLAATNARLDHLVHTGQFRADLYYRLCMFSISLPPLRERRQDIALLAGHFLVKHGRIASCVPQLSAAAAEALLAFDWPGNVRELESAIVRAIHSARNGLIQVADLDLPALPAHVGPPAPLLAGSHSYKTEKRRVVETFERQYLAQLMKDHHGNVTRAANAAGKERRDLGKLLKRYGFDPRQFAA
jgi:DNA-binding NtrC family response regulator